MHRRSRQSLGKRKFGTDITNSTHNAIIDKSQLFNQKHTVSYFSTLCDWEGQILEADTLSFIQNKMGWNKNLYEQTRDPIQDHIQDIHQYSINLSKCFSIESDYMSWQPEVNPLKRQTVVSWLIGVHDELRLKPETLYLGICLLDKYGYKRCIQKNLYHLLGITCLFIAAKYEELKIPRLANYSRRLKNCTNEQILQQQTQILLTINFQLNQLMLPKYILELQLSSLNITDKQQILHLCSYLLELTLLQYQFCFIQSQYLSAVIIYISLKIKQVEGVNSKKIIQLFSLDNLLFKNCFIAITGLYKKRQDFKFVNVNKKYQLL